MDPGINTICYGVGGRKDPDPITRGLKIYFTVLGAAGVFALTTLCIIVPNNNQNRNDGQVQIKHPEKSKPVNVNDQTDRKNSKPDKQVEATKSDLRSSNGLRFHFIRHRVIIRTV